ncbi:unnamed protein product [Calypogeia fissa]
MASQSIMSSTVLRLMVVGVILGVLSVMAESAPTAYPVKWGVPPNMHLGGFRQGGLLEVGDSLHFVYDNTEDNLLGVTSEHFVECNTSAPLREFNDGNTTINFSRPGSYYFICGFPNHCEDGQFLAVEVGEPLGAVSDSAVLEAMAEIVAIEEASESQESALSPDSNGAPMNSMEIEVVETVQVVEITEIVSGSDAKAPEASSLDALVHSMEALAHSLMTSQANSGEELAPSSAGGPTESLTEGNTESLMDAMQSIKTVATHQAHDQVSKAPGPSSPGKSDGTIQRATGQLTCLLCSKSPLLSLLGTECRKEHPGLFAWMPIDVAMATVYLV